MELILKKLGVALFSFALPRIKNAKAVRDFKKKWSKDNYPLKITLMFQAGVDDAKTFLDLPDELIKDLLEDTSIRAEIFRWIIEGISYEEFSSDHLFLDPHYENYPHEKDKIIPFLKLILMKINEFKESTWDPEFQNIIFGIEGLKNEVRTGFLRLEQQQLNQETRINENMKTMFADFLGPVGYEDLQELLNEGKVITARKKAEERLKHTRKSEEKLELNALIANSYLYSGLEKEAIPFLYGAMVECDDHSRKNRLNTLIHLFNGNLKEAHRLVSASIEMEGYTSKNVELLLNIHLLQQDYEKCLLILEEHSFDELKAIRAGILLVLNRFEEALSIVDSELEKKSDSKEWLLLKVDAIVQGMEHSLLNGTPVNPKKVFLEVESILDSIETGNENPRQLFRIKALKAGLHFRNKQFRESAIYFQALYEETSGNEELNYFRNAVWSHYLSGDSESAAKLLEKKLAEGNEATQQENAILLARVYLSAGKPHKALKALESYIQIDPSTKPIEYYLVKMEALFVSLKLTEIEMFVKYVEQNVSVTMANILKGVLSSLKHEWSDTIESLEKELENIEGEMSTEIKLLLIDAYINRGNAKDYQKVIKLIPSILHWSQHERMVQHYIYALYELGNYTEILNYYHNEFSEPSVFVQDIVATIYSENKWFDKSKDLYESLYHQTQNVKFLLGFASCLFHLGKTQECLNTLLLAEKKILKKSSVQDFILLTHAYKTVEHYEKAMEFSYKTFKLGEEDPDVWRFYFNQFTFLSSMVHETDYKQEYVDAYHQVFNQFQEKFPGENFLFEQFKAIEDNGHISDEFINKLKELAEGQIQMESLFERHRMSPEMYRKFTNKEPFQLWGHIANQQNLHFWVNRTGDNQEMLFGIECALNSRHLLCDLFSLLTLNYLNLLDSISQLYQLYISQEQYEALFFEVEYLKLSRTNGIRTLAYNDGKLIGNEATPEQVEHTLQLLDKMIRWIDVNCIKVGNAALNPQKKDDNDVFSSTENSLIICQDYKFNMLIDSHIIKEFAKESYNVNTISVVDYINSLHFRKIIEVDTYYEAIGKLIIMGYRFISAPSTIYQFYVKQNRFDISGEVELLFNYLKEEHVHHEYAFSIALDVLMWLWTEEIDNNKIELTNYLCELILNKPHGNELLKKLPEIIITSGILTPESSKGLEELILLKLNKK